MKDLMQVSVNHLGIGDKGGRLKYGGIKMDTEHIIFRDATNNDKEQLRELFKE